MRSRYVIREPQAAHFITATIVQWLPALSTTGCCDVIVKSLIHCHEKKALQIHAWVILDNHLHLIVSGPQLAETIRDFRRFTARALIAQLEFEKKEWLLNQLAFFRLKHKSNSDHQVWQEGTHPQALTSDTMMEQKLDYLHNNPVRRGWVAAPEHWRYSSAHEWLADATPLFRCDPWR
jgi:putative transposase